MLGVELFVVIFSVLCWLITPMDASQEVQKLGKKNQDETEVKAKVDADAEELYSVDVARDEVVRLSIREARKIARKLNIKQKSGRQSLSKAKLIEQILKVLQAERSKVELALNELSAEQTLAN